MLQKTKFDLTPAILKMLAGMSRVAKRSFGYASIGRQVPGQMRAAPRGYVWFVAGKGPNVIHHRWKNHVDGVTFHEAFEKESPYVTLLDVRLSKKQRMERRVSLGLPPHP